EERGRWLLLRGVNPAKDQSYFLSELTQEQLSYALFPLGAMTKPEVRAIDEAAGLPTAQKPESQEICFIPDGNYARFIERYLEEAESGGPQTASENDLPVANRSVRNEGSTSEADHSMLAPGENVSTSGEVLVQPSGNHRYTYGP